jgi:hypothetical protein
MNKSKKKMEDFKRTVRSDNKGLHDLMQSRFKRDTFSQSSERRLDGLVDRNI